VRVAVVREIIKAGADVDLARANDGTTPLFHGIAIGER